MFSLINKNLYHIKYFRYKFSQSAPYDYELSLSLFLPKNKLSKKSRSFLNDIKSNDIALYANCRIFFLKNSILKSYSWEEDSDFIDTEYTFDNIHEVTTGKLDEFDFINFCENYHLY